MERMIKVNFRGLETKEFPSGTTLLEISKSFKHHFTFPIVIGKVNNDVTELCEEIRRSCDVDFYDRSHPTGNSIYGRSLQFLLVVAVKHLFGNKVELMIEHSIDKGFYCEIVGADINKNDVANIYDEMRKITDEDLVYTKLSVSRLEAIEFFRKRGQIDKAKVLRYISNTYINLYRLDNVYDYFYGEMAYSTGAIDEYRLTYIRDNGFVVSFPDVYGPHGTLDYVHHEMLFNAFLEYTNWGRSLGICNAAELNEVVTTGKYNDLIRVSEAYYNRQLASIADDVYDLKDRLKIILIAGPSSSGKTTTSKKLEIYLRSKGLHTHPISIDDYFINRRDMVKDENGEYDFESIKAVDIELFNQHLLKLMDGERVLLPEFNFATGEREYKKKWLQLGENDIIIIEGLHALNEDLTMSIERKNKYKIYISPLTQLNIDNHNRIHTSDTRRLRRIVRDNKFRGYNASDTLSMWKKIREGEEKWIFPYQDDADFIVNSALVYELGVLKTYAEPLLFSVTEDDPNYAEALRLINFLRNFLPIPSDGVPQDSILREFIGGGCFNE